ncbi:hypothetical protein [Paraburkholderia terrae]
MRDPDARMIRSSSIGAREDMVEYVSEALLAALFPPDAGGPDVLRVAGPVAVDDAVEASGIGYAGTRHLVFFVDVMAYERFRLTGSRHGAAD